MSRKELPRPGIMKTLLTGRITNQQAAAALHMGVRQVQRLKRGLIWMTSFTQQTRIERADM